MHLGRAILYFILVSILIACSDGNDPAATAGSGVAAFNPAQPGADFTPIADQTAATNTINRMWQQLTSPVCWDASFVGNPTAAGTPAGVSQYQFYGQNQYRHVGFSTQAGNLFLHAVGYHNGYDTAIVETWTGDIEALVLVNDTTLVHVLKNPSGVPFTSWYGAAMQGCL